MKVVEGDETKWWRAVPLVFWAERVTIQKTTRYSPYYLAHGVEPVLPFDVVEATYLAPPVTAPMSSADLLAMRARQLGKRKDDLKKAAARVLASRFRSAAAFIRAHKDTIKDYDFQPGDLVLVRNTQIEKELSRKHKDRYLGPLEVVRRHQSRSYTLREVDGAVSRMVYAAFRLIPYHARVGPVKANKEYEREAHISDDSSDEEYEWVTGDEGEEYPEEEPEDDDE